MIVWCDRPLKAALDYAQGPDCGGFWLRVTLRDGREVVGVVMDHGYRDEVDIRVVGDDLVTTGEVEKVSGDDVLRVVVDGDLAATAPTMWQRPTGEDGREYPLTVGGIRAAIVGLPDDAPVVPAWADGPPGDDAPGVTLVGLKVGNGRCPGEAGPQIVVLVELHDPEDDDEGRAEEADG